MEMNPLNAGMDIAGAQTLGLVVEKERDMDEVKAWCQEQISKIVNDSENTLTTDRTDALKYYRAEALGNEIEGRSQVVTSDLADTIEWILPSMMRIFASGDEVCIIQPRGPEDAVMCNLQTELTNWQMRVRNDWFLTVHDALKDALLLKTGVIKYSWETTTKTIDKDYKGLTEPEVIAILQGPDVEVVALKASVDMNMPAPMYDLSVRITVQDECPKIRAVPPEEIGFPMRTRGIEDCTFLFHRVELQEWEVERLYGKNGLESIRDYKGSLGQAISTTVDDERFADLGGDMFWFNSQSDTYYIYECYYPRPEDGNPWMTVLCGDVILFDGENKYGKPPFVVATPVRMAHRIIGRSMYDVVKSFQQLRTVLLRQILDHVYLTNYGRWIVGPDAGEFALDDFLNNNRPGGIIRADVDSIQPLAQPQLQTWSFKLLEYVASEREARTGVTRYNQGLDASSLNRTARGITAILNQSQQRLEMMARIFAEMMISPLISAVVDMNIKFSTRKTSLRVLNDWIEIMPDNLVGDYDVVVQVGIGTGNKDTIIAQMQQLLGIYAQIFKSGIPIVGPDNVYNAMKELVKAMGYRNTDDFVTNPGQIQAVQQLVMSVEQAVMQTGYQEPGLMQALMSVKQLMGQGAQPQALPSPGEGNSTQPVLPQAPTQAMNPVLTSDGGGFYG